MKVRNEQYCQKVGKEGITITLWNNLQANTAATNYLDLMITKEMNQNQIGTLTMHEQDLHNQSTESTLLGGGVFKLGFLNYILSYHWC